MSNEIDERFRNKPDPKAQLALIQGKPLPKRNEPSLPESKPSKPKPAKPAAQPEQAKPKFAFSPSKTKYGKRHKPGEMNGTESEYAEILERRKAAGEIIDWVFETYTFKLADGTRYTPDFAVYFASGEMEFVDTKGGGPIDAKSIVKIKCAAEKFWQFRFTIEQKQSKKNGGNWKRTEY